MNINKWLNIREWQIEYLLLFPFELSDRNFILDVFKLLKLQLFSVVNTQLKMPRPTSQGSLSYYPTLWAASFPICWFFYGKHPITASKISKYTTQSRDCTIS